MENQSNLTPSRRSHPEIHQWQHYAVRRLFLSPFLNLILLLQMTWSSMKNCEKVVLQHTVSYSCLGEENKNNVVAMLLLCQCIFPIP